MRLGHGVRDETKHTRVWFCTCGYLVRLLAHHPEAFNDHTHLIIDEVHERSVDTDILCLLAKRLLDSNPYIRLVLMSATLATQIYREYFNIEQEAIFVGARRFPITEVYCEDLPAVLRLPTNIADAAHKLHAETALGQDPHKQTSKKQYELAVHITRCVGREGSAVLIFVPGMIDIVELIDRFSGLNAAINYKTLAIHGDIPFEEQMEAFNPAGPGEVKVVIATNAAESSVTLPDVDTVICLGAAKQIQYNDMTHRTQLACVWISRANAIQRAGRTGRVRPGTVFRLYARSLFEDWMEDHEEGEMHRQPLDSVILGLRGMLATQVLPILQAVLEPPDIGTIERSFESLNENGLIDHPSDLGELTHMGVFVAALGVDLQIGRMVGLGAQFGCLSEAIAMAAALTIPRPPFRVTSPLIHDDPDEFCDLVYKVMKAQDAFDMGTYSEPIMLMNLMFQHDQLDSGKRHAFCTRHSLAHARMKQLSSTYRHLAARVQGLIGIQPKLWRDPRKMSKSKINVLRLLITWVFKDQVMECKPQKRKVTDADGNVPVVLSGPFIQEEEMSQYVLPSNPDSKVCYTFDSGRRTLIQCNHHCMRAQVDIESDLRVLSMVELQLKAACLVYKIPKQKGNGEGETISMWIRAECINGATEDVLGQVFGKDEVDAALKADSTSTDHTARLSTKATNRKMGSAKKAMELISKGLHITVQPALLVVMCHNCSVEAQSLRKLFQADVSARFAYQDLGEKQALYFPALAKDEDRLIEDIPLGARILNQIQTGYRDKKLRVWYTSMRDKHYPGGVTKTIREKQTLLSVKAALPGPQWGCAPQTGRGGMVYMPRNSLAAAAAHQGREVVYAVAGAMLDIATGGARCEGVTLLPPGTDWLALALLTFGITPFGLDHNLSQKRIDTATAFSDACDCVLGERLEYNEGLTTALSAVFGIDHVASDFGNETPWRILQAEQDEINRQHKEAKEGEGDKVTQAFGNLSIEQNGGKWSRHKGRGSNRASEGEAREKRWQNQAVAMPAALVQEEDISTQSSYAENYIAKVMDLAAAPEAPARKKSEKEKGAKKRSPPPPPSLVIGNNSANNFDGKKQTVAAAPVVPKQQENLLEYVITCVFKKAGVNQVVTAQKVQDEFFKTVGFELNEAAISTTGGKPGVSVEQYIRGVSGVVRHKRTKPWCYKWTGGGTGEEAAKSGKGSKGSNAKAVNGDAANAVAKAGSKKKGKGAKGSKMKATAAEFEPKSSAKANTGKGKAPQQPQQQHHANATKGPKQSQGQGKKAADNTAYAAGQGKAGKTAKKASKVEPTRGTLEEVVQEALQGFAMTEKEVKSYLSTEYGISKAWIKEVLDGGSFTKFLLDIPGVTEAPAIDGPGPKTFTSLNVKEQWDDWL
ncbi:unnamed protein product [Chrysoparadoxa australica]